MEGEEEEGGREVRRGRIGGGGKGGVTWKGRRREGRCDLEGGASSMRIRAGGGARKGRGEEGSSVRGTEGLKTEEEGGRRRKGLKREVE